MLLGTGLVALLVLAFPTYRYETARAVDVALVECDSGGRRGDCTALWTLGDGRHCRVRVVTDTTRAERVGHRRIRTDGGCGQLNGIAPALFYAVLIMLIFLSAIAGVLTLHARFALRRAG